MYRKVFGIILLIIMGMTLLPAHASENPPAAPFDLNSGHPACAGVSFETPSTPDCEALMASRPAPNFGRVDVDLGIIANISLAQYVEEEVTIYDAPGGSEIETILPTHRPGLCLSLVSGTSTDI